MEVPAAKKAEFNAVKASMLADAQRLAAAGVRSDVAERFSRRRYSGTNWTMPTTWQSDDWRTWWREYVTTLDILKPRTGGTDVTTSEYDRFFEPFTPELRAAITKYCVDSGILGAVSIETMLEDWITCRILSDATEAAAIELCALPENTWTPVKPHRAPSAAAQHVSAGGVCIVDADLTLCERVGCAQIAGCDKLHRAPSAGGMCIVGVDLTARERVGCVQIAECDKPHRAPSAATQRAKAPDACASCGVDLTLRERCDDLCRPCADSGL